VLSTAVTAQKQKTFGELPNDVGQETIEFCLDYLVTLTDSGLQTRAIEHGDLGSLVRNKPRVVQLPGGLGNPFATHAQHVDDQLLGSESETGRSGGQQCQYRYDSGSCHDALPFFVVAA